MADIAAQFSTAWGTFKLQANRQSMVAVAVRTIMANQERYLAVERATGAPWWFVAGLHYRESSNNFTKYLGNGESLSRATTLVPAGRGPWTGPNAWLNGAIDALKYDHLVGKTWNIQLALLRAEKFNGTGYRRFKILSPYVFAGDINQKPGLFVADGDFDPKKNDNRVGVAALWKYLPINWKKYGG